MGTTSWESSVPSKISPRTCSLHRLYPASLGVCLIFELPFSPPVFYPAWAWPITEWSRTPALLCQPAGSLQTFFASKLPLYPRISPEKILVYSFIGMRLYKPHVILQQQIVFIGLRYIYIGVALLIGACNIYVIQLIVSHPLITRLGRLYTIFSIALSFTADCLGTPYIYAYTSLCACSCNLLEDAGHYFSDLRPTTRATMVPRANPVRGPYPVEILSLFLPLSSPGFAIVRAIVLGECKANDISPLKRVPEY